MDTAHVTTVPDRPSGVPENFRRAPDGRWTHPMHLGREFEIEGFDGEVQTASNGIVSCTLYPADSVTKMRKRNFIKRAGSPQAYKVQWLYAEIDGVRLYVDLAGQNALLSCRKLNHEIGKTLADLAESNDVCVIRAGSFVGGGKVKEEWHTSELEGVWVYARWDDDSHLYLVVSRKRLHSVYEIVDEAMVGVD